MFKWAANALACAVCAMCLRYVCPISPDLLVRLALPGLEVEDGTLDVHPHMHPRVGEWSLRRF